MHFITAEWLRSRDACPEDIASFNERYPEGVDALTHLRSLAEHNPSWGLWVAVRLPEFTQVRSHWLLWVLGNPQYGAIRAAEGDERTLGAVRTVIALLERDVKGDSPSREEWDRADAAAARVADGAETMATEWATRAAWAAARGRGLAVAWAAWAAAQGMAAQWAADAAWAGMTAQWAAWARARAVENAEAHANAKQVVKQAREQAVRIAQLVVQKMQLHKLIELLDQETSKSKVC